MAVNIKKDFGNTRSRKPDLTTLIYGKVPPQAPELEEAVLGACMLERNSFERVMEILPTPECFYMDAHQKIYTACCELYNSGGMVDLLTITEQLRKGNDLEVVGGAYYLTRLTQAVLSSAHIEAHARIVMQKYLQRELIRISGQVINAAYEDSTDVFELIDQTDTDLQQLKDGIVTTQDATSLGEIYMDVLMDIQEQKMLKSELVGVDTGYVELNRVLLGMCKGDFIGIGARPSQGKTALLLNLLQNAVESRISRAGAGLIFSIESSKKNLGRRYAASKCSIPLKTIREGSTNELQDELMQRYMQDFARMPISIDDKTQELSRIVAAIRKAHKKYMKTQAGKDGLPFIVGIDYIQLITIIGNMTDEARVSKVSQTLKKLGIELDIIIIALIQLNRDAGKRSDDKPRLMDMRNSGQLEQDLQVGLLIWHEQIPQPDGKVQVKTHLLVAKNKDGECTDVELKTNFDIQRWMNLEDYNQSSPASFVTGNYQTYRDPSAPNNNINWDDEN
jgi:replicative DNA helicase